MENLKKMVFSLLVVGSFVCTDVFAMDRAGSAQKRRSLRLNPELVEKFQGQKVQDQKETLKRKKSQEKSEKVEDVVMNDAPQEGDFVDGDNPSGEEEVQDDIELDDKDEEIQEPAPEKRRKKAVLPKISLKKEQGGIIKVLVEEKDSVLEYVRDDEDVKISFEDECFVVENNLVGEKMLFVSIKLAVKGSVKRDLINSADQINLGVCDGSFCFIDENNNVLAVFDNRNVIGKAMTVLEENSFKTAGGLSATSFATSAVAFMVNPLLGAGIFIVQNGIAFGFGVNGLRKLGPVQYVLGKAGSAVRTAATGVGNATRSVGRTVAAGAIWTGQSARNFGGKVWASVNPMNLACVQNLPCFRKSTPQTEEPEVKEKKKGQERKPVKRKPRKKTKKKSGKRKRSKRK